MDPKGTFFVLGCCVKIVLVYYYELTAGAVCVDEWRPGISGILEGADPDHGVDIGENHRGVKSLFKKIFTCCAALLICATAVFRVAAQEVSVPNLSAGAACLMDADSGQILLEKNMDTQLPPASITKIMTILLAVENGDWDDIVTMTDASVFSVPRDATHIALTPGETLTLEQALMATMLRSANDAANGVAETIGGTIEQFVEMMNSRAAEIGAVNTHFVNANGLDDPEHLTTAHDMALITREAIQNEDFLRVFTTMEYEIPPTNKQSEARSYSAGNKLVFDFSDYYDPDVIGAKRGYTGEAHHTLVSVAQRDGRTLVCVVLAETEISALYEDTIALLDYGFTAFSEVTITPQELALEIDANQAQLATTEPVSLLLAGGADAEAVAANYQVEDGDRYNITIRVDFSLKEDTGAQYAQLGSTQLRYVLPLTATAATAQQQEEKGSLLMTALKLLGLAAGVALGVFVLLLLYVRLRYDLRRAIRRWKRRNTVKKGIYAPVSRPTVQPTIQLQKITKVDAMPTRTQPKNKRYS